MSSPLLRHFLYKMSATLLLPRDFFCQIVPSPPQTPLTSIQLIINISVGAEPFRGPPLLFFNEFTEKICVQAFQFLSCSAFRQIRWTSPPTKGTSFQKDFIGWGWGKYQSKTLNCKKNGLFKQSSLASVRCIGILVKRRFPFFTQTQLVSAIKDFILRVSCRVNHHHHHHCYRYSCCLKAVSY